MAIRYELVESLLNDARQELAKIDIQRNELIELINNLQKHLPKRIDTGNIAKEAEVSVGVAPPVRRIRFNPPPTIPLSPGQRIAFKRRNSHASGYPRYWPNLAGL